MATKRTPAELVAYRAEELAKSQRKLARAKDPAILDLEHLRMDLNGWSLTIAKDLSLSWVASDMEPAQTSFVTAVRFLDRYIDHRIQRALAAD